MSKDCFSTHFKAMYDLKETTSSVVEKRSNNCLTIGTNKILPFGSSTDNILKEKNKEKKITWTSR